MFSDLVSSPQRPIANQTRSEIRDCVDQEAHELVWDRMVWPAVHQTWDPVATPVTSLIAEIARASTDRFPKRMSFLIFKINCIDK